MGASTLLRVNIRMKVSNSVNSSWLHSITAKFLLAARRTGAELQDYYSSIVTWILRNLPWIESRFLFSRGWLTSFLAFFGLLLLADFYLQLRNRIDVNTYYYTFSTIAQSLASAFGFLVAVGLYRISAMETGMELEMNQVIDHVGDSNEVNILRRMNECHYWDDMDRFVSQDAIDKLPSDTIKTLVSTSWRNFKRGREEVAVLKIALVSALRLTSITIASSVLLIPVSKSFNQEPGNGFSSVPSLSMFALFGLSFLSCRCLGCYWEIGSRLTDRKPRDIYRSA